MLSHLDLSSCGIKDILIYNRRLEHLNLCHNRITHFDAVVFYNFDRIYDLILSNNPLTMITNSYNMRVRSCYECFTRTLDFSNTLLNATSLEVPLFFHELRAATVDRPVCVAEKRRAFSPWFVWAQSPVKSGWSTLMPEQTNWRKSQFPRIVVCRRRSIAAKRGFWKRHWSGALWHPGPSRQPGLNTVTASDRTSWIRIRGRFCLIFGPVNQSSPKFYPKLANLLKDEGRKGGG